MALFERWQWRETQAEMIEGNENRKFEERLVATMKNSEDYVSEEAIKIILNPWYCFLKVFSATFYLENFLTREKLQN